MCGRFTLRTPSDKLGEMFACDIAPDLSPRYNIAPTQLVASVRRHSDAASRQFALLRWGLIPSWAKDVSMGARMINARGETVAAKPAFRTAFRRHRCLVLADGFFEWLKTGKAKQPYYIRMQDDRPFAFAGLWELWRDRSTDQTLESCTIITTEANELTRRVHDRMPVILDEADYDLWLDPAMQDPDRLQPLLRPFDPDGMRVDPVDRHVSSPRNDDPKCIQIVDD